MNFEWIQEAVREEHISSLFKEHTWHFVKTQVPEIKELSIIGDKGTWVSSHKGVTKSDRVEFYVHLTKEWLTQLEEKQLMKLSKKIHYLLKQSCKTDIMIEVKIETNQIGKHSGFVYRDDLKRPVKYWHNKGIQAFKSRIICNAE